MIEYIKDVIKMWLITIKSMLMPDINEVPDDLGNNRFSITNNTIVTISGLKQIIKIHSLGNNLPESVISLIMNKIAERHLKCYVDYTFNFFRCTPLEDDKYSINQRYKTWEYIASNKENEYTDYEVEEARWALATVDDMKNRDIVLKTRLYITITGSAIDILDCINIIKGVLNDANATYEIIQSNLKRVYEKLNLVSLSGFEKDDSYFYSNLDIISELLPTPLKIVSRHGVTFGIDTTKNVPYKIDFANIDTARNIMFLAESGSGKTYTVYNIMQSAFEYGERPCVMDIKGNEFNKVIRSMGGSIINLSNKDNHYINCFKLNPNTSDPEYEWSTNYELAIDTLMILSECPEDSEVYTQLRTTMYSFYDTLLQSSSIIKDNVKTWYFSEHFNIRVIYDEMIEFFRKSVDNALYAKYDPYIKNIRKYVYGEFSYIFEEELSIGMFLDAPAISFAFYITEGMDKDRTTSTIYKLKFKYMTLISRRYMFSNYSKGIRTLKIMEEGQVAGDQIVKEYIQDFTIGRSYMQDNIFIANSLKAIEKNAEAVQENVKVLIQSELKKGIQDSVISTFGMEDYVDIIKDLRNQEPFTLFIYDRLNGGVVSYIKTFSGSFGKNNRLWITIPDKEI